MALTNSDKDLLRDEVCRCLREGKDIRQTVTKLKKLGFKPSTIRQYFHTFRG